MTWQSKELKGVEEQGQAMDKSARIPRKRAPSAGEAGPASGAERTAGSVPAGLVPAESSPTEVASGQILARLRRIEGQVRGVQRMIEARQECEAVLTQLLAVRAAMDRVAGQVVAAHLEECLAGRSPAEARAAIDRAVHLLSRGG